MWSSWHRIHANNDQYWSLYFIFLKFRERRPTCHRQSTRGSWPPSNFLYQVERRFHSRETNRQPIPWDLGISPPPSNTLGSSHTTILKSSMSIKCHFGRQKSFFLCLLWEHFTKMQPAKFPPFTVKASLETACDKIHWLKFVNRNMAGLQSWYSSRHFQIPITPATSTWHWLHLRLGKHNYMWTWIFQTELGEEWSHKFDWNLKHWMNWCKCHYAVFR